MIFYCPFPVLDQEGEDKFGKAERDRERGKLGTRGERAVINFL